MILADKTKSEYFSNETIKFENKPNKEQEREMGDKTAKIKMQPNKIKLMIESVRQKNSAPIAKRISGDGAFCLFNSFIFVWNLFCRVCPYWRSGMVPEKARAQRAIFWDSKRRHLYIYKGTPCAHLPKKAVFCRVISYLIV